MKEKKYHSIGFLKFKLPDHDQNKVDEFLKNPENTNCFKKEYFKEVTFDGYNISLFTFPESEEPLCMGAPSPYSNIQLNYIDSDFTKTDFKKPEFYTWVKDEKLSTQSLNVFKNTNSYQAVSREYFLIIDKESTKDDGIIISINPATPEESIEYQYALSLIKAFEIKESTEFTGLSNCKNDECKNLDISLKYEHTRTNKEKTYTALNYKISFTDTKTGNEYFKYVNPKIDSETDSVIIDMRKFYNYIIFIYTIKDAKDIDNSTETSKIGILDLNTGQIRDLIVNPVGLRFQDYLVAGDDIFFVTGEVKKLTNNFEIFGDVKITKQKELGVVKYNKLTIKDGLLIESLENN